MIDREARDNLALALRRLASGRITNTDFDDLIAEFMYRRDRPGLCHCGYDLRGAPHARCSECGNISDPALRELATFGWLHYSDLEDYALVDKHALTREQRRTFVRAVVFLKSDREYTHDCAIWNTTSLSSSALILLVCLGLPALAGAIAWQLVSAFAGGLVFCIASVITRLLPWCAEVAQQTVAYARGRGGNESSLLQTCWPFQSAIEMRDEASRPIFLAGRP